MEKIEITNTPPPKLWFFHLKSWSQVLLDFPKIGSSKLVVSCGGILKGERTCNRTLNISAFNIQMRFALQKRGKKKRKKERKPFYIERCDENTYICMNMCGYPPAVIEHIFPLIYVFTSHLFFFLKKIVFQKQLFIGGYQPGWTERRLL